MELTRNESGIHTSIKPTYDYVLAKEEEEEDYHHYLHANIESCILAGMINHARFSLPRPS